MNNQLKVDVLNKNNNKTKNSFGNSFSFNDDLFAQQNQFSNINFNDKKNKISEKKNQEKIQLGKNANGIINQKNIDLVKSKVFGENESNHYEAIQKKKNKNKSKVYDQDGPNQVIQIQQTPPEKAVKPKKENQQSQKVKNEKSAKNKQKIKNNQNDVKSPSKQHKQIKTPIKQSKSPTNNKQETKNLQKGKIESHQKVQSFKHKNNQTPEKKQKFKIIKNDKIDTQNTKIYEIKNNANRLNSSLQNIKQEYRQLDKIDAAQQIMFRKNNRMKQMQIRQFLTKKRLQKQKRQQKINQIRNKQKQHISKTIQVQQIEKQKQRQQKINKIKSIDYIQPKIRRQKYFEQQQKGKQIASAIIQKYKNNEPFHLRKQKQFKERINKRKQEQEQILMERKQRYQSLDIDELEQHKRIHEDRLEELENIKKQQRQEEWNKIQQDNNLMRDQIWKGPSHDLVDQQRLEIRRKKRQPKEKVKKMKNYYDYIKKNFLPKTHQPKRSSPIHKQKISESLGNYSGKYHAPSEQELAHYDPGKKHVKKYRFLNGKAIGQVIQSVLVSRSYSQQKKIGQEYLAHLKNLPKKKQFSESTTQIDSQDLEMINNKFNEITKVKRESIPFYQNSSRKRTVSISVKPTKQEVKMVYEQLRNQDIKLKSKRKLIRSLKQNSPSSYDFQKQVNANMVLNMQRKLDLLTKLH